MDKYTDEKVDFWVIYNERCNEIALFTITVCVYSPHYCCQQYAPSTVYCAIRVCVCVSACEDKSITVSLLL